MNPLLSLALLTATALTSKGEPTSEVVRPDSEIILQRIAQIGCHQQNEPAPALFRYLEAKPDLTIWVGDNVYADTKDDIEFIKGCYQVLANKPEFQQLRKQTITMAGWDDHDYGLNNQGKNYLLKKESQAVFREFWQSENYIPAEQEGIYHSRIFGNGERATQVIVLDGRYHRDDEGPESDTLGEEQWRWLAGELEKPATLRFIVSGYQVLMDPNTPWESWTKFPKARQRLFDLIKSTKAKGVIFLTGDQHSGEVLREPDALGYDAVEFMFAGINQEELHCKATYRVTPAAHAKHAHALIDIHWDDDFQDPEKNESADQPHLIFTVFDSLKNAPELTYRINFSELQ